MKPQQIKQMIETKLPGAQAIVQGDGDHFEAIVICNEFVGKTILKQHQMVYGTLGNSFQSDIHALSIKTYTLKEWDLVPK